MGSPRVTAAGLRGSSSMLAGYAHLLAAAERLQWDAEAIDLSADGAAVCRLTDDEHATLSGLVAGFVVAEHAVAAELGPFVEATAGPDGDPLASACFARQARDEARHARFFDRVWAEVLADDQPHGEDDSPQATTALRELFEIELPAAAHALADDAGELGAAVGLYHLVLEGIVFAVGQEALLGLATDHALSGIAAGVTRVQADERWHVGLGVLQLQRLGAEVDVDGPARRALAAWGPAVATPERTERVLGAHARRLTIAGGRATRVR